MDYQYWYSMDGWLDGWRVGGLDGWMECWMVGLLDGCIVGLLDGWRVCLPAGNDFWIDQETLKGQSQIKNIKRLN